MQACWDSHTPADFEFVILERFEVPEHWAGVRELLGVLGKERVERWVRKERVLTQRWLDEREAYWVAELRPTLNTLDVVLA